MFAKRGSSGISLSGWSASHVRGATTGTDTITTHPQPFEYLTCWFKGINSTPSRNVPGARVPNHARPSTLVDISVAPVIHGKDCFPHPPPWPSVCVCLCPCESYARMTSPHSSVSYAAMDVSPLCLSSACSASMFSPPLRRFLPPLPWLSKRDADTRREGRREERERMEGTAKSENNGQLDTQTRLFLMLSAPRWGEHHHNRRHLPPHLPCDSSHTPSVSPQFWPRQDCRRTCEAAGATSYYSLYYPHCRSGRLSLPWGERK